MAAAAPPVSDCGCRSSSSSGGGSTGDGIYPLHGILDPNVAGIVPPFSLDKIWEYDQWDDPLAGPTINLWKWNPNLSLWQ